MPKIKERNQTDKVKGKKKGGGPAQAATRRVMTAKLKKELIQQKRSGASSAAEIPRDSFTDISNTATGSASADSSAEAVDRVEQTTQAAAVEVGSYAKRGAYLSLL